jgi:GNAT superfamily N-acetyltransferase
MNAKLLVRDARIQDRTAIIQMLSAAYVDSDIVRWLEPDPESRPAYTTRYLDATVTDATAHGIIRVADERGDVVGAALWFPHPSSRPAEQSPEDPASERLRLLDALRARHHPSGPAHHHLAFLGVRPDRQRQGIGSFLLIGHHAYLHVAGMPAYVEAGDPRNRNLYLRHGYTDLRMPIVLPTGIPIWPMWRAPIPAGVMSVSEVFARPLFGTDPGTAVQ